MQQRALLYALDNHLGVITEFHRHKLIAPLSAVALVIDGIEATSRKAEIDLSTPTKQLRELNQSVSQILSELGDDIVGFSHNEERSVAELIDAARRLNRPDTLSSRKISINVNCDENYKVYCSLLLKEVFYNIISNSVYWITQRQQETPSHKGFINISVTRIVNNEATEDQQERELNTRIKISFRDNGPGLSADQKAKVSERGFTLRKGGTGYGLFAAREYITSLGGDIQISSEEGRFFEVTLLMDEYDSKLHVERDASAFLGTDI